MCESRWKKDIRYPRSSLRNCILQDSTSLLLRRKDSGEEKCSLKVEGLLSKLKSVGNLSTLEPSYMTNSISQLKQSKSALSNKSYLFQESYRETLEKFFFDNNENFAQLEEIVKSLWDKQKEEADWGGRFMVIAIELQKVQQLLEQIKMKVTVTPNRKGALGVFHSIFQKPVNMKMSSSAVNGKSRKETISSILRDNSLLLSFKKNLEEDDGYVTLKYSEQSNQKEKDAEPISQHFQSFAKFDQKINKKLSYKDEPDDQFNSPLDLLDISQLVWGKELQKTKLSIVAKKKQIEEAFSIYEQLLQKFIEAIAQQKVESEEQRKIQQFQTQQEFLKIQSMLKTLRIDRARSEQRIQSKLSQIKESIFSELDAQRTQRQQEQRGMIKMMLKIVEYLQ